MPMSSSVAPRQRRFPSILAMLAVAVLSVAGCDDSTGSDDQIATLTVNPPTPTLNIGGVQQLVATPSTSSGRIVDNATVTWTTSAANVATVAANGLVTAVGGGSATITATVGDLSSNATVTVLFPVATVTVSPAAGQPTTIRQEGATQLQVSFTDTQGATVTGRQVIWASSNPAVATVNTAGGVAALGIDGTTNITATTVVGNIVGTLPITVSGSPVVATVTVAPAPGLVGTGNTLQLTRTARAASGTIIPGVATTWTSSTPAAATVDANGLVTPVAPGTTTITATAEGVSGTSVVTVLTSVVNGVPTVVPSIADGAFLDLAVTLPAGQASLNANTTATGGDIDLYVFAPGAVPGPFAGSTFANFTCRPWLFGSTESCSIPTPAAGVWRIRLHNFPGEGAATNTTLNVNWAP